MKFLKDLSRLALLTTSLSATACEKEASIPLNPGEIEDVTTQISEFTKACRAGQSVSKERFDVKHALAASNATNIDIAALACRSNKPFVSGITFDKNDVNCELENFMRWKGRPTVIWHCTKPDSGGTWG